MTQLRAWAAVALTAVMLCGCSGPQKPAAPESAPKAAEPVRITQFYSPTPTVRRGQKAMLCYGVENAKAVRLSPAQEGVYPAFSRCVDVSPGETRKYTLTAEGVDGKTVTRELAITVSAAKAPTAAEGTGVRIVQLAASSLQVRPGEMVTICYQVERAQAVRIEPIGYTGGADGKGCATDQPRQTTTYTLTAKGDGGEARQSVLVKVGQ